MTLAQVICEPTLAIAKAMSAFTNVVTTAFSAAREPVVKRQKSLGPKFRLAPCMATHRRAPSRLQSVGISAEMPFQTALDA